MPVWAPPESLPHLVLERVSQTAPAESREVTQVDDELHVEWREQRYDLETGKIHYLGGIKATYGPTTILADELELDTVARTGIARGTVRLIDPLGVLEGSTLRFNWGDRTGQAEDVRADVMGMRLRMRQVSIEADRWVGEDAWATPCTQRRPSLVAESRRVVLRPGRSGRANDVTLSLFGLKSPRIPYATFSLDRRVEGFRIPAVSFRRGQGLGIAWGSGVLLNDQTSLNANYSTFPKGLPTGSVELAWSTVPPTKATGFLSPRSDLGERFADSYLDRVFVRHPDHEALQLRSPRRTVALSTSWNQGVAARRVDSGQITKRFEAAAEYSDNLAGWGALGQVRLQSIRPYHRTPFTNRLVLVGTAQSPEWNLWGDFSARLRLDGFGTMGGGTGFGWGRALSAVAWSPNDDLRLTAGIFHATEFGRAQFGFDGLRVKSGALLRGDVRYGPITVNAILKTDFRRGRSYSTEWGVAWVMGCFEPFMQSRNVPRDFQFGVRLRVESFLGRLTQREFTR